jgi:hypothetical protein
MASVVTYKIQTQRVSIHKEDGTRINYSRKGEWRDWDRHKERVENVRDAIAYATRTRNTLTAAQWGCIVVVRTVLNGRSTPAYDKIYQSKFGTNGVPFDEFCGIAGDYWRRQLEGKR